MIKSTAYFYGHHNSDKNECPVENIYIHVVTAFKPINSQRIPFLPFVHCWQPLSSKMQSWGGVESLVEYFSPIPGTVRK